MLPKRRLTSSPVPQEKCSSWSCMKSLPTRLRAGAQNIKGVCGHSQSDGVRNKGPAHRAPCDCQSMQDSLCACSPEERGEESSSHKLIITRSGYIGCYLLSSGSPAWLQSRQASANGQN